MKVTVNYYTGLRQASGKDSETLTFAKEMALRELAEHLGATYGEGANKALFDADGTFRPTLMALVNGNVVDKHEPYTVKDGDEVTFLEAVAGG